MKRPVVGPLRSVAGIAFLTVAMAGMAEGQLAAGSALAPGEIVRKVEAAGYTKVHDLEYDDGRWEVEATSSKGNTVELDVDPHSGEITHEEVD